MTRRGAVMLTMKRPLRVGPFPKKWAGQSVNFQASRKRTPRSQCRSPVTVPSQNALRDDFLANHPPVSRMTGERSNVGQALAVGIGTGGYWDGFTILAKPQCGTTPISTPVLSCSANLSTMSALARL